VKRKERKKSEGKQQSITSKLGEIISPIPRVFTKLSKVYNSDFFIPINSLNRMDIIIETFSISIFHKIALIRFEGV
jgi:hypothetical protein